MRECTVVLVTEDPQTIDIITGAGEQIGYEVQVYRDSMDALDALYENPSRCDLLIADEDMKGLPGSFLAERFLEMRELVEVILLIPGTGIGSDAAERSVRVRSIRRPLTAKDLSPSCLSLLASISI